MAGLAAVHAHDGLGDVHRRHATVTTVRVVAGSARGRGLVAPPGSTVRPTTDRVREAVFNALGSLGVLEGARVADIFAGSGAMGIEALSRGARHAVFVERDARARSAIRRNLEATNLDGAAEVVNADALAWLRRDVDESFDLVIADPPYRFDRWEDLLAGLDAAIVVVESDRAVPLGERWELLRGRRYGSTWVGIAQCVSPLTSRELP